MKSLLHQGGFSSLKTRTKAYMDAQRREWYTFLAAMTTAAASTVPTFCSQQGNTPTMKGIMLSMLDVVYNLALFVGIGILVFGLVKWFMAMQDENPEGQSRAIKQAVVGVALICFKTFVAPIINSVLP